MSRDIQNLLFDLDGTLVDSSQTIGVSIDFALDGMNIDNALNKPIEAMIGRPLLEIPHDGRAGIYGNRPLS